MENIGYDAFPFFGSIEMGEQPLVKTVANVFREVCYGNRDSLTAGIICAGWDKREGGQVQLYDVHVLFTVMPWLLPPSMKYNQQVTSLRKQNDKN